MSRIDSHQHFWQFIPERDAWITHEMSVLRQDFMPADLEPLLLKYGVEGCIAVQADQSESETRFLLTLAQRFDFIKGVVGWIDLRAANVHDRLAYFSGFSKFKGVRHIVQDEPDTDFLLRPEWLRGIAALQQYDYTYDILIRAHQLDVTARFIEKFPNQRFVIDHLAKPPIGTGNRREWTRGITDVSQYKNVYCKLSGLITEGNLTGWKISDFDYYINHIIEVFGPNRLLFGSDWPVCLLAGKYGDVVTIIERALAHLSEEQCDRIWRKNAIVCYKL